MTNLKEVNHYYYNQVDNRILRLPGHIFVVLYCQYVFFTFPILPVFTNSHLLPGSKLGLEKEDKDANIVLKYTNDVIAFINLNKKFH